MRLEINGAGAYAYTGGKAFDPALPAIVLIHGAQNDHSVWALQSRYLAHHGYAVLAVDLPGHGRSGGPALSSVEAMADWILAVLAAAGVERALLARRQRARDWFLRTLEYAGGVGAQHVTLLPGVEFADEEPARSWDRAVVELAWRVEQAARCGIVCAVEAHVGSLVSEPQRALRLVQETPGLTLTVDYTHFTRAGLADCAVEPLLAYASHFHVRGACPGRLQTSFAGNTIDYARVVALLQQRSYAGWLGIEYVWIDWERCNECDNLSETILYRDQLRQLLSAAL